MSHTSRRGFIGRCMAGLLGMGIAATGSIVKAASSPIPVDPFPSWNRLPLSPSSLEYAETMEWMRSAMAQIKFIPPVPPPPPKPEAVANSCVVHAGEIKFFDTNDSSVLWVTDDMMNIDLDPVMTIGSERTGKIVFNPGGTITEVDGALEIRQL